jgi:3-oxoacyl-[acyl-carrier-protein] synthase III
MYHSKISGLGYYVPENIVTNDDLSKIMDTNDEWIQERTGIQERRHIIRGEDTTTSMGVKAAKIAIERSGCCQRRYRFCHFALLSVLIIIFQVQVF